MGGAVRSRVTNEAKRRGKGGRVCVCVYVFVFPPLEEKTCIQ